MAAEVIFYNFALNICNLLIAVLFADNITIIATQKKNSLIKLECCFDPISIEFRVTSSIRRELESEFAL